MVKWIKMADPFPNWGVEPEMVVIHYSKIDGLEWKIRLIYDNSNL